MLFFGGTDSLFEHLGEACSLEDIVAQDKACRVAADEISADGECLCESVRRWLLGIGELDSIVGAIAQEMSLF